MVKLIRIYFKIISPIFPIFASKIAFEMFQKVRIKTLRKREENFFLEAKPFQLPFGKEDLSCYDFNSESKDLVLLVHGWESNAGSMHEFAKSLIKEGKHVVSFNLPGHAFYKSRTTNLFECKQALQTILNHLPEYNNLSIISHSFGSAATAYALSELDIKIDTLIFLTSMNSIEEVFIEYKKIIGINQQAYDFLMEKADKILEEPLRDLYIDQKLNLVKFKHLYLIHDKNDKVIPFRNSENIHQKHQNSTLIPFENIGHYRMLWNPDVISKAVNCLN